MSDGWIWPDKDIEPAPSDDENAPECDRQQMDLCDQPAGQSQLKSTGPTKKTTLDRF